MTTKPQSTTEPIEAPERVTLWICCHCQTPRMVGLTVCERCHKKLHDVVEYIRLSPASAAPVVDEDRLARTLQAEAELAAEHPHDGYDCGGTCAFHNPALRFPAAAATAAPVEQSDPSQPHDWVGNGDNCELPGCTLGVLEHLQLPEIDFSK